MKMNMSTRKTLSIVLLFYLIEAELLSCSRLISSTVEVLRSKGYLAEDHYVEVEDGRWRLNVVRATNPLINNGKSGLPDRGPILFVHGVMQNSNGWFAINDGHVRQDFSDQDINKLGELELRELLKSRPGGESLAFTALNFGYEVWFLNRRSTTATLKANGLGSAVGDLSSLSSIKRYHEYWNYTLDDQAKYDIPETIEYVLRQTNKQNLSYVSLSAGSTVFLMALADRPELAEKINKAILYAPPFDLGFGYIPGLVDKLMIAALPITSKSALAVPDIEPPKLLTLINAFFDVNCRSILLRPLVCVPFFDILEGKGTAQLQTEYLRKENQLFESYGVLEIAQFVASIKKTRMHHFDYMNSRQNLLAYGQPDAPIYDIGRIQLPRMSFYLGHTDRLASVANFNLTKQRLRVPFKEHIIGGQNGVIFNHIGSQLHNKITDLVIVPTMRELAAN